MPPTTAMTMRCDIERDEGSASAWGEIEPSWTSHLTGVQCRVWHEPTTPAERSTENAPDEAAVEVMGAVVPVGTDITDNGYRYRIPSAGVTDRAGNTVFAGPIRIESVLRRRGHLALRCRRTVGDG